MAEQHPRDLIQRLADELDTWLMAHHHGGVPPEIQHAATLVAKARAYLAQPEPEGLTQAEAVALYSEVMAVHDCQTLGEMAEHFSRAVLARWGRPAVEPVPVSKRPWEREGWCDNNGWCWGFDADDTDPFWSFDMPGTCACWTHLLPHYALPVPVATEKP